MLPIPLKRVEDVLLNRECRVQDRYTFTTRGLSSIAQRVSSGLAMLLVELAGLRESLGAAVMPDPDLARKVFNEVVRSRFQNRLAGHRLVVDPGRATIEGVVSARYEFVSNYQWLEECHEFVLRTSPSAQFLEAALSGRRLLLRYVDDAAWVQLPAPDGTTDVYRRGWSFSNSETGESSLRVGLLLADSSGNCCLRDLDRRLHTRSLRKDRGKKLLAGLQQAFEASDPDTVRRRLERLRQTTLSAGADTASAQKAAKALAAKLTKRLSRSTARSVVSYTMAPVIAVAAGSSNTLFDSDRLARMYLSAESRSLYDLYSTITSRARELLPNYQERAESLAFDLLSGKFNPT